jgi:hypothetical protein
MEMAHSIAAVVQMVVQSLGNQELHLYLKLLETL